MSEKGDGVFLFFVFTGIRDKNVFRVSLWKKTLSKWYFVLEELYEVWPDLSY